MIGSVIFDYGGVICASPRNHKVASILGLSQTQQKQFIQRMQAPDITEIAEGKHPQNHLIKALARVLPHLSETAIDKALKQASTAKPCMIKLIEQLKKNHAIYLMSNSLPVYSQFIRENYGYLFDNMYFSDELKARKPTQMFDMIIKADGNIFKNSVYIDDKPDNLTYPANMGASTVLFKSKTDLEKKLVNVVMANT